MPPKTKTNKNEKDWAFENIKIHINLKDRKCGYRVKSNISREVKNRIVSIIN